MNNERVSDLLCNAFEGGSNYWICSMTARPAKHPLPLQENEDIRGFYAIPFTGGSITIRGMDGTYTLDKEALEVGERVMQEKYSCHWADVVNENDDATTGDVFLQCCLFSEVIYG